VWIGGLALKPELCESSLKEIAMWNSNRSSEFISGINGTNPSCGIAPLQYDLARQVYLEKRRAHVETDRRSTALAGWTALSQWANDTSKLSYQTALHWFSVRMGRSVPETSHS
jgi:hypothetical protein